MKTGFTIQYLEQQLAAGKIRGYKVNNPEPVSNSGEQPKEKKRSKYGNKKTDVDGIEFDSMKEAKRYGELKLMLKAGHIGLLELQKEYVLEIDGKKVCKYYADFVYLDMKTGLTIVEDVKSEATKKKDKYRVVKKLMKAIHNIEIKEV